MPQKWRIYRVVLIINSALVGLMILSYIYFYFGSGYRVLISYRDISILLLSSLLYFSNLLYSFRLLSVNFPKRESTSFSKSLSVTLLVIFCILLLVILLFFWYGFYEEFVENRGRDYQDNAGIYALLFLFIMISMGFYNVIMQIKLLSRFSAIFRENRQRIIDEIGQETSL